MATFFVGDIHGNATALGADGRPRPRVRHNTNRSGHYRVRRTHGYSITGSTCVSGRRVIVLTSAKTLWTPSRSQEDLN